MSLWVSLLSLSLSPSFSPLLLTAVQGDWQVLQNPKRKTAQNWLTSHWLPVQRLQFHLWWQWWSLVSCGRADGRHGSLLSAVQLAKYWQNCLSNTSAQFLSLQCIPDIKNTLSVCFSCVSQTLKTRFLCVSPVSPRHQKHAFCVSFLCLPNIKNTLSKVSFLSPNIKKHVFCGTFQCLPNI